jgi:hypothetical protein
VFIVRNMDGPELKILMTAKLETLKAERLAVRTKLEAIDRLLEAVHVVLEAVEGTSIAAPEWRIDPKVNVVSKVKDILRKAGTEGLYPREIRVALSKEGINSSPQVVSNALCKLRLRDYSVEANGRHFYKEFESMIRELQTANPA